MCNNIGNIVTLIYDYSPTLKILAYVLSTIDLLNLQTLIPEYNKESESQPITNNLVIGSR